MSLVNPAPDPTNPAGGQEGEKRLLKEAAAERANPVPGSLDDTGSYRPDGKSLAPLTSQVEGDFRLPADLVDHPRYLVLDYVGSGGMGMVFKAQHRLMKRLVALKVIHPSLVNRPTLVERFHDEIKAAASLSHPNIVTAHDADQAGETHFLVMEFVPGVNLDRVAAEQGQMHVAAACDYGRQTALGLQHAFRRGMVHRDIKPHNLMLTPEGQVKILDFGLAHFISEMLLGEADTVLDFEVRDQDERFSEQVGELLAAAPTPVIREKVGEGLSYVSSGKGTPDYIAPEEIQDAHRADIRADIYSLGCTLYRFLAGQVPFPEESGANKFNAHRNKKPQALGELRPHLPAALVQVVERMMAKEPAERYQTPVEVAQGLIPFCASSLNHILLVDDDLEIRTLLARTLELRGYSVSCAADGREALDRLHNAPQPGLILLDLMMPVMDGWEFLQVQKQDPALASIPVVIISAANKARAGVAALAAADFLEKPFGGDHLAATVQCHMKKAGALPVAQGR